MIFLQFFTKARPHPSGWIALDLAETPLLPTIPNERALDTDMLSHTESFQRLEDWFSKIDASITAFSGGVDSALVLFLSRRFLGKEKGIGCIANSPSLKRSDLQLARTFSQEWDIRLEEIETQEIEDEAYAANPPNRCFACKSHLYEDMEHLLTRFPSFTLLNGTNQDDLGDYRPGLEAARQHHARSPLADCGLGKAEVRALAKSLNLPLWDKPASPCLSSRIPYGQRVTREKLEQIESAESRIAQRGFTQARVRHFGHSARIEVTQDELPKLRSLWPEIESEILALGFEKCELDPEGLVSGKLNRSLNR